MYDTVTILQGELSDIQNANEYPTPDGFSMQTSINFIPKYLYRMILWLTDQKTYESADPDYKASDDIKLLNVFYLEVESILLLNTWVLQNNFTVTLDLKN